MSISNENNPQEIIEKQAKRRANKLARWISGISAAIDTKGGAGIAVRSPEQQADIIEALENKAGGKGNIKRIDAHNNVEGAYDPRTNTIASSLQSFELKREENGIIIVEGVDALGTMKRGGGNPHINEHLSRLALWRRTEHPKVIPRMPVVAIGVIALGEEVHLTGNLVRRSDMGSSFIDMFDAHFLVEPHSNGQLGTIRPLRFQALDPRSAGFGLSHSRPPADYSNDFDIAQDVRDSNVETQLP